MDQADGGIARRGVNRRNIAMMLVAAAVFSLMDMVMKLLSAHYPAMQVAALRALVSLPLVGAYVVWRGAHRSLLRIRWPMHLLRAVLGIAMLALFAYGLKTLSLAEAYTVFFIAPALITALSVLLLKERVHRGQWIAIAVGMGGVLVVLRPSGAGFLSMGALAVLCAAALYAISAISARILSRTDRSEHIVFWLMVMMATGATALALPGWLPLRGGDTLLLCALAVTGFAGQLAITAAFGSGEASKVAPFEYSALAWGVGLDWLLWRVLPDRYTMLGAAIIIGSGIYLIRREGTHAEAEHP